MWQLLSSIKNIEVLVETWHRLKIIIFCSHTNYCIGILKQFFCNLKYYNFTGTFSMKAILNRHFISDVNQFLCPNLMLQETLKWFQWHTIMTNIFNAHYSKIHKKVQFGEIALYILKANINVFEKKNFFRATPKGQAEWWKNFKKRWF